MSKLINTKKAYLEYINVGRPLTNSMFEKAKSLEDYDKAWIAEEKELKKLHEAFYEDTKDINCRDNCSLLSFKDIKEMIEK